MKYDLGAAPADPKRIILEEIRHKWKRLSEQDLSSLRNSGDLIIRLMEKYGLSNKYASWEVDNFLKCRTF
jgi:hypothetical protein